MHETKICRRYFTELLGAFVLFSLVLVASLTVGRPMPHGIERMLVLFSPLLPFLLIMAAVVRYFRRVDEYLRQIILENWAITAAITFGGTFLYGFLENAGFPRLSMFTICPVMGTVSAIVFFVRRMMVR